MAPTFETPLTPSRPDEIVVAAALTCTSRRQGLGSEQVDLMKVQHPAREKVRLSSDSTFCSCPSISICRSRSSSQDFELIPMIWSERRLKDNWEEELLNYYFLTPRPVDEHSGGDDNQVSKIANEKSTCQSDLQYASHSIPIEPIQANPGPFSMTDFTYPNSFQPLSGVCTCRKVCHTADTQETVEGWRKKALISKHRNVGQPSDHHDLSKIQDVDQGAETKEVIPRSKTNYIERALYLVRKGHQTALRPSGAPTIRTKSCDDTERSGNGEMFRGLRQAAKALFSLPRSAKTETSLKVESKADLGEMRILPHRVKIIGCPHRSTVFGDFVGYGSSNSSESNVVLTKDKTCTCSGPALVSEALPATELSNFAPYVREQSSSATLTDRSGYPQSEEMAGKSCSMPTHDRAELRNGRKQELVDFTGGLDREVVLFDNFIAANHKSIAIARQLESKVIRSHYGQDERRIYGEMF